MEIATPYTYHCDLLSGALVTSVRSPLHEGDALADVFCVTISKGEVPVSLKNMGVYGRLSYAFPRRTILLEGYVQDNAACVALNADCYAVTGPTVLTIQIKDGDVYHTVLSVSMDINRTGISNAELSGPLGPTLADLFAQRVQLKPEFANDISECTDQSALYVLPDGYIYAYMRTEKETPAYANRVLTSIDTDGSIFNETGYMEGYRLNSSAAQTAADNAILSGFMPYNGEGIQLRIGNQVPTGSSVTYVWGYDANFNKVDPGDVMDVPNSYGLVSTAGSTYEKDAKSRYIITVSDAALEYYKTCKYIRASAYYDDVSDFAVALDEEITDTPIITTTYAWENTGHAFVPADYEDRIITLESDSADHESRLKSLEANETGSGVPVYWLDELDAKTDAIQQAMETAGRDKSAFLWYTDAHWTAGNAKVSPALLDYLYRRTPMTKTNFGGDIVGDPSSLTHENVEFAYNEWRSAIKGLPNHHSVIGNHDNLHKGQDDSDVSNMVYTFLIAPEESPDMVMGGDLYYYIDNPCEMTRYLYLDSGRFAISDAEATFIINTLRTTPDGWHVVAISHIWFQYTSATTPTVGSVNTYMQKVLTLFDAYNARQSGSVTMVNESQAYDFTASGGKVEFCIGGHIHVDHEVYSAGGIPVILTASDTNQERSSDETEDSGTVGTTTEAAVYGIVADYTNSKISVIGVGRGGSRVIDL